MNEDLNANVLTCEMIGDEEAYRPCSIPSCKGKLRKAVVCLWCFTLMYLLLPVPAAWLEWEPWSDCSKSCAEDVEDDDDEDDEGNGNVGVRRRQRSFTPGRYGAPVQPEGSRYETEKCNKKPCPGRYIV